MRALLASTLVLLLSWPCLATETRVRSLGGAEQQFLVLDEFNVLHLPATLVLFPNLTYAEFAAVWPDSQDDTGLGQYGGLFAFHYALSTDTVLAFYGSSSHRSVLGSAVEYIGDWSGSDMEDDELLGEASVSRADHKGTLMLAHRMGDVRLGLQLGFWGRTTSVDAPESQQMNRGGSQFEAGVGLGFDLPEAQSFDLAGSFSMGWFDDDRWVVQGGDSYLATRLDVSTEWSAKLLARGVLKLGSEKIVPFATVGLGGGGVAWNQDVADAPDVSVSTLFIAAGTNLVLQPLEGVFVMPGVGLRWGSQSLEDGGDTQLGTTVLNPYVGVAVDARVATWLALRFGARQNLTWTGAEAATLEMSGSDTDTEMTLGLAVRLGQVDVDWMVNPRMLVEGPAVLSGSNAAVPFATQASVKFTW